MNLLKLLCPLFFVSIVCTNQLAARDVILEFKSAAFLPKDCIFKNIYGKAAALYGPEITVQACDGSNWYGFASVDYLKEHGCSQGLSNKTKVSLLPLACGIKYFAADCYDCINFYVGLGLQTVRVSTSDCSNFVINKKSQWAFGGIAKAGAYIDLSCHFLLDLFVDYSFAKTDKEAQCCNENSFTAPRKANVSGAIIGAGLGYKF